MLHQSSQINPKSTQLKNVNNHKFHQSPKSPLSPKTAKIGMFRKNENNIQKGTHNINSSKKIETTKH